MWKRTRTAAALLTNAEDATEVCWNIASVSHTPGATRTVVVSATNEVMKGRDLSCQLGKDIVELVAVVHPRQQCLVLLLRSVPIDPVHIFVKKEVALQSPGVIEHRRTLSLRVNTDAQTAQIDTGLFRWLEVLNVGVDQMQLVTSQQQQNLAAIG